MTLVILMLPLTCTAHAGTELLDSKAVYYTEESDYQPGDCILTATRMMIRRAAIMSGRTGWEGITNEVFRQEATVDGCLLSNFAFEACGLSFRVGFGEFSGESDAARIAEFEELLKRHPEGIVVHGDCAASTGMHGVLVARVDNGVVYAMDSSFNMGEISEGIQKWTDTTMLEPSLCTRYWYISEISPDIIGAQVMFTNDCQDITQMVGRSMMDHCNILRRRITSV